MTQINNPGEPVKTTATTAGEPDVKTTQTIPTQDQGDYLPDTVETPQIETPTLNDILNEETLATQEQEAEPVAHPVIEEAIPSTPEIEIQERKPQNLVIESRIFYPAHDIEDGDLGISLPSDTDKRISEVLSLAPNVTLGDTAKGEEWVETTRRSIGMSPYGDTFSATLEDPNADFGQTVQANGLKVGPYAIGHKEQKNTVFSGEIALLRLMNHLGIGTAFNMPLWNSGMWVVFKPPAEEEIVELFRQLTSDQIRLGRETYGMVFSNTTSFTVERMARFAVQHIYRICADPNKINAANILDHIKVQDLPLFLLGLACTMYPKGFLYSRACMINPEKCQHVVKELIDPSKMIFVNKAPLSEQQRVHMGVNRGTTTITEKDLAFYQNQLTAAAPYRFIVNEGRRNEVAVTLRSPSVREYIESGHRWIDDMTTMVESVLGASGSAEDKNTLVELKSKASLLRQYAHWIDKLEFDTNTIEDRATIENTLSQISADNDLRDQVLTEVRNYIERSSIAVVGIPTYVCPACGHNHEGPDNFPMKSSVIPIDVLQLFFVLLTRKHQDLQSRFVAA